MKPRTSAALNDATIAAENLMNAVRRDTLNEVIEELIEKSVCYARLMENGRNILETCHGDRFERIYKKRLQCWSLIAGLSSVQRILISKL